jgi:hypothetical protein
MKKPLKCKLGIHSRYLDCAIITCVHRCNDCDWIDPRDRLMAVMQVRERRALIYLLPSGFSMLEAEAAVAALEEVERGTLG